jgi:Tol biopolymer transport system component
MHRVAQGEAVTIAGPVALAGAPVRPEPLEQPVVVTAVPQEVDAPASAWDIPASSNVPDDLELYADDAPVALASARREVSSPARPRRLTMGCILATLAVGALLVAVGSGWYWLLRDQPVGPRVAAEVREAPRASASESLVHGGEGLTRAGVEVDPAIPATVAYARAGQPTPLSLDDGAFSPAFAASGRELFFHAGRGDAGRLLMASLDDRGQVSRVSALFDEHARNYHPRVSPDGRLLAFDSDREGERGVYVSERDGSNPERVSGSGYGAVPSWSPDMRWLAFVRGEAGRPRVWNLWLRDLSSGGMQRHTAFRSGQVWGASWFPDGRSLCFSHETRLVISHLDDRDDVVIDTPRPGRLVRTPAVSPDGRLVVFQVFKDGVWLLDVQTRQVRRILGDPSAEEFSWSPDGRRIAYHSRRDGTWRIWMMNAPG